MRESYSYCNYFNSHLFSAWRNGTCFQLKLPRLPESPKNFPDSHSTQTNIPHCKFVILFNAIPQLKTIDAKSAGKSHILGLFNYA